MAYKLEQDEIDRLVLYDWENDWESDWDRSLQFIRSFGIDIPLCDLPWFFEKFLPDEQQRLSKKHPKSEPAPSKAKTAGQNGYSVPKSPEVGRKYHLSWAHRGCVWKLKELLPEGRCILMTPKTKKTIIAKTADLLNLKGQ